ncbi:MAG TPA: ImmA/IrrE family metallo-endopeptidase [Planctomycetaceae bacterium]|jgi:hypothetical protein
MSFDPRSNAQIERIATDFLRRVSPRSLRLPLKLDVLDIFERLEDAPFNLNPGVKDLAPGVEGMTYSDGRIEITEATYRGLVRGEGRPRFTVMHEIAHAIMHMKQMLKMPFVETQVLQRRSLKPFEDPEWQANVFASAALMPAEMVRLIASRNNWPVARPDEVVSVFGVSLPAAEVRLKKLGLLK